jgi:Ca2+-binding EF-hand superfamily protein
MMTDAYKVLQLNGNQSEQDVEDYLMASDLNNSGRQNFEDFCVRILAGGVR